MKRVLIKHAVRGPWTLESLKDAETEVREGPPPPGVLHGDEWCEATGEIKRATQGPIVGILDFANKTKYGFSSNGTPQYIFHPLDIRYPPMIVGSRAAHRTNQLAVVSTNNMIWNTTKAKWPQAGLQQILGPVGDPVAEMDALCRQVLRDIPRRPTVEVSKEALLAVGGPVEDWPTCFNIDPAGCRDVDDVIAWRSTTDGRSTEFAIAIANVSALIPVGSELDEYARQRLQTVYDPAGAVVNAMLPTAISEGAGSLLADGVARGVVAAVWRICGDGVAEGPEWRTFRLINRRTYTYDSVLEDQETCKKLKEFLGAISGVLEIGEDPHKWIETAMVSYNAAAAHRLIEAGAGVLRRHRGHVGTRCTAEELRNLAAAAGIAELAFLGYAAGEYISTASADDERVHSGLGLTAYCHASSPLRRYADLINQRILVGLTGPTATATATVGPPELNRRAKEVKAFERAVWCLQNLAADRLSKASGWILGWGPGPQEGEVKLQIYVPNWSRTCRVILRSPTGTSAGASGSGIEAIAVGRRDGEGGCWECRKGQKVQMTAYWDLRATPENRFVFRVDPCDVLSVEYSIP
jgi:exoribonuclease R